MDRSCELTEKGLKKLAFVRVHILLQKKNKINSVSSETQGVIWEIEPSY